MPTPMPPAIDNSPPLAANARSRDGNIICPFYPARPVNGGPLDKAIPKLGDWYYEAKINGWRTLVHAPTGSMFTRRGEILSIASEFSRALERLVTLANPYYAWLDCEAFERRHPLGRGTLVVLDLPAAPGDYLERQDAINALVHDGIADLWQHEQSPPPCGTVARMAYGYEFIEQQLRQGQRPQASLDPLETWGRLQAVNRRLGHEVFEGLVAKRGNSPYPHQLRSPDTEFPFWVKHRWAY